MYILSLIQYLQELLVELLGRGPRATIISNAILVIFTVFIYWLLYVLVFRVFRKLSQKIVREDSQVKPLRIQKQEILSADEVARILNVTLLAISWILRLWIILTFVNTILALFTWTRDLSIAIATFVGGIILSIWNGFINYLPDFFTALVIIGIAYLVIRLFRLVFDGMARQRIKVPGFYPEWSRTSYNLLRLLIIAMTIVVVFPYLPGSSSPAFQGVSIFIGVLLSLGSTTAVANVVAGIVITFTRAFRIGDYVNISGTEGKIIERTAFVTRIRTSKNVEVSIPNSAIMSDKVVNYSTQAKQNGIALHTGVTIGYDVPWTRVQELLLAAAARTEHVNSDPEPYVLQKSLDDNYVAYELNAFSNRADLRPRIYSELHANILNSFHEAGVEITSPHYRATRDGNAPAIPPTVPVTEPEM